jgi:hypothetical protein
VDAVNADAKADDVTSAELARPKASKALKALDAVSELQKSCSLWGLSRRRRLDS